MSVFMRRSRKEDLNDPKISADRALLLRSHPYLRALYSYWYHSVLSQLPSCSGQIIELGSGGGFLKECLPSVITSDVLFISGVDLIMDARMPPIRQNSIRAIVGTNALHHIPEVWKFLQQAEWMLMAGGRLIFMEPWPTVWSRFVYRYLHHEPFEMDAEWELPEGGPLTAANGALPWILFERDRKDFLKEFPSFSILSIKTLMPVSYLACGGIGHAWPLPGSWFAILRALESMFDGLGMFSLITIEKVR